MPSLSAKKNAVVESFGDRKDFLLEFKPGSHGEIFDNRADCFVNEHFPTLGMLNAAYGKETASMWLVLHLTDLSEYCGCRDKISGYQLKECSRIIAREFYYLKVSEIMLFFYEFKSGLYGKFYGSVDPLIITTSLRSFLTRRNDAIAMHDEELRKEAADKRRGKEVTYQQYCAMIGKDSGHEKTLPERKETPFDEAVNAARMTLRIQDLNARRKFSSVFAKKYGCEPQIFLHEYNQKVH